MNIVKNQIDELNIELTLTIGSEDYAPIKKKKLSDYRKKAEFKGFRKGNVPMGLIEKVYGEQALGDAVNDIISDQLNAFIEENKLNLIGEPIASENQPEIEWKDGNDFTFKFDMGCAPEIDFEVSKDDKVVYYNIESTKVAVEEMKKNMLMQFGDLQEVDTPTAESYIYVDLQNEEKTIENGYISMRDVTEALKPALLGVKAGDKLEINVNELYEREGDRATLLKVKKEALATLNPVFNATIVNIKNFTAAEANTETFDKIFGEGQVKDENEFNAAVEARLAENYKQEADFRLGKDLKEYFTAKADVKLPESFLKRWLFNLNKGKFTMEEIEKEFDSFLTDYRWSLINEYLMKKFELKLEPSEIEDAAKSYVAYQYAMYGMANVPENFIQESAQKILQDQQQVQRLAEQVAEQKVFASVKEVITLSNKKISVEKFRELK